MPAPVQDSLNPIEPRHPFGFRQHEVGEGPRGRAEALTLPLDEVPLAYQREPLYVEHAQLPGGKLGLDDVQGGHPPQAEAGLHGLKARLAGMEAGLSARLGAALRHAGHFLSHRRNQKKLLLVLTDGAPHDVDVKDPKRLLADAGQAVVEFEGEGIFAWCINLDPKADEYVAGIFGHRYTIIDHVERLPEVLPRLF